MKAKLLALWFCLMAVMGISVLEKKFAQTELVPSVIMGKVYAQETLVPVEVVASEVPEVQPSFETVAHILKYLETIPTVGKYLKAAIEIIGGVGAVATLLFVLIAGIANVPILVTKLPGLTGFAEAADKFREKIQPILNFLKYFSVMNVKKK